MAGIFAHVTDDLFAIYRVRLSFRDRVVGGTPSNPKLIEAWIRKKMGISNEVEIHNLTIQTLKQLGISPEMLTEDGKEVLTFENLSAAATHIAKTSNTTMFKRHPLTGELCVEQRAVKAGLKETAAILYPGTVVAEADPGAVSNRWGQTGKAPRSAMAEWVFIDPDFITLGVDEPTAIDLSIGHISGPQGPRSTLDYYEYVERSTIEFTMMVLENRVPGFSWPHMWVYYEQSGLGAKRSQGFGRFDIVAFDPMNDMAKGAESRHAQLARAYQEERRSKRQADRPKRGRGRPPEGEPDDQVPAPGQLQRQAGARNGGPPPPPPANGGGHRPLGADADRRVPDRARRRARR